MGDRLNLENMLGWLVALKFKVVSAPSLLYFGINLQSDTVLAYFGNLLYLCNLLYFLNSTLCLLDAERPHGATRHTSAGVGALSHCCSDAACRDAAPPRLPPAAPLATHRPAADSRRVCA